MKGLVPNILYYRYIEDSEHKKGQTPLRLCYKYKEYSTYKGSIDPSCIMDISRIVKMKRKYCPFMYYRNINNSEPRKDHVTFLVF